MFQNLAADLVGAAIGGENLLGRKLQPDVGHVGPLPVAMNQAYASNKYSFEAIRAGVLG